MATYSNISALEAATSSISANFLDLDRSVAPTIASNGAIGLNTSEYENVSYQRQAVWTAMLALEEDSASDLAPAITAMQYGFQQEQADGSFYNADADAADGWTNTELDAFFLQSFVQIYLGVKNSPLWSTYKTQLSALIPKFSTAMNWLPPRPPRFPRPTPRRRIGSAWMRSLSNWRANPRITTALSRPGSILSTRP